jgi:hypothetical protein
MPRFRWEPDNDDDLQALIASAVAERRPLALQVEVLMKRALDATRRPSSPGSCANCGAPSPAPSRAGHAGRPEGAGAPTVECSDAA